MGRALMGSCACGHDLALFSPQADLDKNNALSFDEWVRLLALNYSSLLSPKEGQKLGS